MKEKRILDALNGINDEYIDEVKLGESRKVKKYWVRWTALAASLVLVIVLGTELKNYIFPKQIYCGTETENVGNSSQGLEVTIDTERDKGFSVVTSSTDILSLEEGRGLLTQNPWNQEMESLKYPVYKNLAYVSLAGAPAYLSEEELLAMAEDVASKLNTNISEWKYFYIDEPDVEKNGMASQIVAKSELAQITIYGDGRVTIIFNESISLDEEYLMTNDKDINEAEEVAYYLAEKYQILYGEKNVKANCSVFYDLAGNREIYFNIFTMVESGNPIEEYCFGQMQFHGDENGNLKIIHFGDLRKTVQLVGSYEIISQEEARTRLEEGNFFSILSKEDAFGGAFSDDNIGRVELVYLTTSTSRYYQPYYCFYVEVESNTANEVNYCSYYVPALTETYIDNFLEENPLGN